jgi:hypothetical protein
MTYLASSTFGGMRFSEEDKELKAFGEQMSVLGKDRLFIIGREAIKDNDYRKAELIYNHLSNPEEKDSLTSIYLDLIKARAKLSTHLDLEKIAEEFMSEHGCEGLLELIDGSVAKGTGAVSKIIYSMNLTQKLYESGEISREDTLVIEHIIDNLPFSNINPSEREAFNHSYGNFKTYLFQNT